ncbi:MAG TPA: hypothetical protein VJB65_02485, partial [Patescibacteria group bacterium]|nr:hypothetical protein [Patescibacteria group bacterium]
LDGTIQTIPRDTVNTDYKKARVEVTWENQFLNQPVILITTVVPNGIETTSGGGTIWIEVYSTDATPLSNATIEIINTAVTPAVPLSLQTDTDGRLILPGAPAAIQAYQITVSKNGYSSEQTYSIDEIHNPHPDPNHLTVIESEVTTKTFTIDTVSELRIHLEDYTTHTSLANIPVRIIGKKRIGTDLEGNDIPKYNTTLTTDATGTITLSAMEHDIYTITLQDATLDFAGSSPHIPLVLAPNSSVDLTISAAPHAEQTALITVEDANETVISDAQVHLTHTILLYDQTQNTNNFGQTFFTPLELGTYTIEITKEGFAPYTGTIDVLENTQQIISLITATP